MCLIGTVDTRTSLLALIEDLGPGLWFACSALKANTILLNAFGPLGYN